MRTLDSESYAELVSSKLRAFEQAMNDGFNKLNKLQPLADPGEKVIMLHALILKGEKFDESEFTEEDFAGRQKIIDEQMVRVKALVNEELQPYSPTEKELELLVVTPSEILDCMITEEKYRNDLSKYINGQSS